MTAQPLPLQNLRVAILVADGFEQVEMTQPREALQKAGAVTQLVSPSKGEVQSSQHEVPAEAFPVDVNVSDADPAQFDALLVPGGVGSPDKLRSDNKSMLFVHAFEVANKPIAAICHGPWVLVETDFLRGKRVTSWPSLRTDIRNAGGNWVDEAPVRDGLLVTARNPQDIPAFNKAIIELFTPQTAAAASATT
ncbi:MAG TPA: type 1 glutamine amidotransferase domain-containing protein [Candidatus Tumulicola sp.]|jgi:protease I